ncbi:MAG: N-6 DNA methylase, partial [Coriobacteriales bacterium]|nr:N-6 DNA methylase [Coriobacteriales bacterium]
ALTAKITAALALSKHENRLLDASVPTRDRLLALEDGSLFLEFGVSNMLTGDFFSWYVHDEYWSLYENFVDRLLESFRNVDFSTEHKNKTATIDLFKELYMSFVPKALRHALGEYYTPDWLAQHVINESEWSPSQSLLDPTCGSGTFLLEALKRRLAAYPASATAEQLLAGLTGTDINPIAVLSAKASIVLALADRLDSASPCHLPIYLADAINPALCNNGMFNHTLNTEIGLFNFSVPERIVRNARFAKAFELIRSLIEADYSAETILEHFALVIAVDAEEIDVFLHTIETLITLHREDWNSIWASILIDRFTVGSLPDFDVIVGNPPWVKWSHLPRKYAEMIQPFCNTLGVFSDAVWVGGIESDISTVVLYSVLKKFGKIGTRLSFLITGSVFSNASSQGFRRWILDEHRNMQIISVEDFGDISPFDGVTNHTCLLNLEVTEQKNEYPIPYIIWNAQKDTNGNKTRRFDNSAVFDTTVSCTALEAIPVPGTDAGPWLKGTETQLKDWSLVFRPDMNNSYKARKGITTDANGIFFVSLKQNVKGKIEITNNPSLGRKSGIPTISRTVESSHLYPLLRGSGVTRWAASPDKVYRALVPQNSLQGDKSLPTSCPLTYSYLKSFRKVLEQRSSYRKFQPKSSPYWSLWSTGAYTFSPWKVLWREINGKSARFSAAYIGSFSDPILGKRVVVPDHKLYFVPCVNEEEAAYITAVLNSKTVSSAISAYAAQLSLGTSVIDYLGIPVFDFDNELHNDICCLGMSATHNNLFSDSDEERLDKLVRLLLELVTSPSSR